MKKIKLQKISPEVLAIYESFKAKPVSEHIASLGALQAAFRIIKGLRPKNILEFGGGIGTFSYLFLKHSQAQVDIFENYQLCIEQLKENLQGFEKRYHLLTDYSHLNLPHNFYDLFVFDGGPYSLIPEIIKQTDGVKVVFFEGRRFGAQEIFLSFLKNKYAVRYLKYYHHKNEKKCGYAMVCCKAGRTRRVLSFFGNRFFFFLEYLKIRGYDGFKECFKKLLKKLSINFIRVKIRQRGFLFNPGPTNVSENVRNALKTADICHREKEFSDVLSQVREKLLKIAGGENTHTVIPFVASATGANEAIIAAVSGKVLLINNGKYSERLQSILLRYKIPFVEVVFNPLEPINLSKVEEFLQKDSAITHLCFVHHETTTGMVNPLHGLGRLANRYGKIMFADTVSSLGGYDINVREDNLSFCSVSSNKCLQSFPGISFVIADKEELKKTEGRSRSFYFDLHRQFEFVENKKQTAFTPAVQLFFALNIALDELLAESLAGRIARYKNNGDLMRRGLKKIGFQFLLADSQQSNILTALKIASNMDYWQIHDSLKKRNLIIYSGKALLEKNIFRIAHFGAIGEKEINYFLKNLINTLEDLNMSPKYD